MDCSSKNLSLLLIILSILSISSATRTIEPECSSCPKSHTPSTKSPAVPLPPITLPPVTLPPVIVPKVPLPPVTVPKVPVIVIVPKIPVLPVIVPLPPVTVPKVPDLPVIVPLPPVLLPPVTEPPVVTPPKETPCAPPAPPKKKETCPIDILKLGACVDILGGIVHGVVGDPAVHECCPVLKGLLEIEAAACLCTTLKIRALNLKIYVPIALQLLIFCGKTPPPGYTCSASV